MKKIIFVFGVLLMVGGIVPLRAQKGQKGQDADTLVWNNRRYAVGVLADVPSVVTSYFQRVSVATPFQFWSSSNNRGHAATLEIINNDLYLSRIEAKRYKTRTNNIWAATGIDTVVAPAYFNIRPLDTAVSVGDAVIADWFSGILELTLLPHDKKELKSEEAKGRRLLLVDRGHIVENLFLSAADIKALAKKGGGDDAALRQKRQMLEMQQRYNNFFTRCALDRERVTYNGHPGLFDHGTTALPMVMLGLQNDVSRWPWSWSSAHTPTGTARQGGADGNDGSWSSAHTPTGATGQGGADGNDGSWSSAHTPTGTAGQGGADGNDGSWSSARAQTGAPFGEWIIRNDSLFLAGVAIHWGESTYSYDSLTLSLAELPEPLSASGSERFADWVSGDYVIHYGSWHTDDFGVKSYSVVRTQTLHLRDGIVSHSKFSPRGFDDDAIAAADTGFSVCNETQVYAVADKQLAESVGSYSAPKKNPAYKGDKTALRAYLGARPLTDPRAKERLFRVRIGFMVNCNGKAGQWRLINNNRGELYEYANMVLDVVSKMPQNWTPATDRKGNAVDCWQIIEFTVSNGSLSNANYK